MAARTNKQGIASKKKQQQKQANRLKGAKRHEYPKRKLDIQEGKDFGVIGVVTNLKGNTYNWFLKGRKICVETGCRIDPDGCRYIMSPSGQSIVVEKIPSAYERNKMRKNNKR